MSGPFFSVIIATYNRGRLLQNALKSLISQTTDDWEAIVVDDESYDDTYSQIMPYLRTYKQIRYFRKEHSGCAMSKNAGISLAAGKYITFLDSDDEYEMNHLESRKKILEEHPSVQFLHGGVKIIGNQFVPDRFDFEKSVNLDDCVIGGTFFIEKNTLGTLEGFKKISLGEDADLYERAKNSGISIKTTLLPTYIYHHESIDSITNMLHQKNTLKKVNQGATVG